MKLICILMLPLALCAEGRQDREVSVDFAAVTGSVKPVNGVGQPPMVGKLGDWSMMHYLKEAGVPYARLHDVSGWLGGGLFVDIPVVFPDFDADENDPKNYRFAYTDDLIAALVKNGVEPFFRLGVSIENFVAKGLPRVHTMVPKDFEKWARISEHVIRHYTEGWANGFKYKIAYWEIWNEPDNYESVAENQMWGGTFDEYIRFYGVTATYLKAKFPQLKIGGYASCGFYAASGATRVTAANSSPRLGYFVDCAHKFLAAARDNGWPLDFFSFHSYSRPADALKQVAIADATLDAYGFTLAKTERIFNEWLPGPGQDALGTMRQATEIAAELIGLQNGPCDVACIYDARCGISAYSPLFNPLTMKPHKAYYTFVAFNELRKLGSAVRVTGAPRGVYIAAATDGKGKGAVMIANLSGKSWPLQFSLGDYRIASARVLDASHDFAASAIPPEIPRDTVWVLDCLGCGY